MRNVTLKRIFADPERGSRYRLHGGWRTVAAVILVVEFLSPALPLLKADADAPRRRVPAALHAPERIRTPTNVRVNKTVPLTNRAPAPLAFTSPVTDDQLTAVLVFEEKLSPIGGKTSAAENGALAAATLAYLNNRDDLAPFEGFLQAYPQSPWKATLLTNLGIFYHRGGYYSKALEAWRQAWALAKREPSALGTAAADRSVTELVKLLSGVGRSEEIQPLLDEVKDRPMLGTPATQLKDARAAQSVMFKKPGIAFKCGPYALANIQRFLHPEKPTDPLFIKVKSSKRGFSADQLRDLSGQLQMGMQVAKRSPGAAFKLPAVVHWKAGHYAAILKSQEGKFLVEDPTFGHGLWMTQAALESEASGYFLVPAGDLPAGWTSVGKDEATGVWGRGYAEPNDQSQTKPCDCNTGCSSSGWAGDDSSAITVGNIGMATYSIVLMLASLRIQDTPVSYVPAYGPSLDFTLRYNQFEASQSGAYVSSNFGPNWAPPWLSYVSQQSSVAGSSVTCVPMGGGFEYYNTNTYVANTPAGTGGKYGILAQGQVSLKTFPTTNPDRSSDSNQLRYERWHSDGSREIFDSPSDAQGHVYLTQMVDAQGSILSLVYQSVSAGYRLASVVDALGQVTTFSYGLAGDTLKITAITDPFGRAVNFKYTASSPYQLLSITDVVGITSKFTYATGTSAITSLTTPYGTTTFQASQNSSGSAELLITDPNGGQERALAPNPGDTGYEIFSVVVEPLPSVSFAVGIGLDGANMLDGLNTFYWDKKAMMDAPGDLSKSHVYHWLYNNVVGSRSGILYCEKRALESRVWYDYDRTGMWSSAVYDVGRSDQPTGVARLLDDGTTQYSTSQYNSLGNLTQSTDPLGRQTNYTYDAATGMDVILVQGMGGDVLSKTVYDVTYPPHLPKTITDASGRTTTFTYNAQGQVLTVVNAKSETTTFSYNGSHQLSSVTGPVAGATVSYTYDGYGRVRTVTDSEGYVLTYDYDALNRPTLVTYPDGTYEQCVYDRLDLAQQKDRLNRWTTYSYDALRNRSSVEDPLGRVTRFAYCTCGQLVAMVDPAGHTVAWLRDIQKREIARVNPDGTEKLSSYDLAGRLISTTDEKGQICHYSYFLDNDLNQTTWTSVASPMAPVSFTYDANYNRVLTMQDGTGTTSYTYNSYSTANPPATTTGAGRRATESSPLANSTITYSYDELGRGIGVQINGAANSSSWTFDSLGRVTGVTNPLGTFGYTYVNTTSRPNVVTYPNGQHTTFAWFNNAGDQRLQEMKHTTAASAVISQFDYTYNAVGNILTWAQQLGTASQAYGFQYDAADQLLSATLQDAAIPPNVTEHVYGYDAAANRTSEQLSTGSGSPTSSTITSSSYNARNQLLSKAGGGSLKFSGTLSQPATVSVAGTPALVSGNTFTGSAAVTSGSNNVTVTATPASGTSVSHTYQVTVSGGAAATLSYDLNGNTLSDGTRTYEWDAKNRLSAINYSGTLNRTEFSYDGLDRRVAIVEKSGGTVTGTKTFVWLGTSLAEERDASNAVTRQFYGQGEKIGSTVCFFSRDHLGSVREMTDGTGAVRARYDYDPYGRASKVSGDLDSDFGYTGLYAHASGFCLALYRAYSPDLGRWLSEDPIGEEGGINLYAYVGNRPVEAWDPLGLRALTDCEKKTLAPYVPKDILDVADLHDGEVPMWLKKNANAVTLGNDIYVRPGRYDSKTAKGMALLAHELVHVGQYKLEGLNKLKYLAEAALHGSGLDNRYEKPAYELQAKVYDDLTKQKFKGCPSQK